jgi:PAS domain S-box-containing protein
LGLVYWLAVAAAVTLVSPVDKIALFWPANAFVAAALILSPRRHWPLYLAAMAAAFLAGRIPTGTLPFYVFVGFCAANIIEVVVVAEAVKRFAGGAVSHDTLTRVLPVATLAMAPATLMSATIAVAVVDWAEPRVNFWSGWVGWLTGDLSGLLLVLPPLLAWLAPGAPGIGAYRAGEVIERILIAVVLMVIGAAIAGHLSRDSEVSMLFPYLVFPVLIWTAIRAGIRTSTLTTLAVGLYAVLLTYTGHGPYTFLKLSAFDQVVVMKAGLITISVTTVFLSVVVAGRRQVERALEASRQTLRSVIDAVPAMINAKDRDSRYVFMNRYQAELYGTTPEAAVGRTAADMVGSGYGAHTQTIDAEVLATNQPKLNYEERWRDLKGAWHVLLTTKVPLRDDTGRATHVVTVALDITERVLAEEERRHALKRAEEASRAKSEFLATISHELRTPLNAILGFAEMLSLQYLGPLGVPKYAEYANDIHASGTYLLDLVNDILDISTIEAGKKSLFKERISISEAIAECGKAVASQAYKRGVVLAVRTPAGLPDIRADRRAIKQILINLLTNAVKFTPSGGRIDVSAEATPDATVIRIVDNGIGIDQKQVAILIAPFERGRSDPYVSKDGIGLGLAITNSLVKLHDGTLAIASVPGKGTTVTVTLPND